MWWALAGREQGTERKEGADPSRGPAARLEQGAAARLEQGDRSEERRVGKECLL